MKLEFDDAIGMTNTEIVEIEKQTKFKLTSEVIQLFKNHSGGRFKDGKAYFINWDADFDESLDTWITNVQTKDTILDNWKFRSYLNEYTDFASLQENYVETDKLFPIFEVVDGTIYIAIGGLNDEKIYYTRSSQDGILNIATNLTQFIKKLKWID